MKLLIWCELGTGGIADYAHDQAAALSDRGIDVELLCPPSFMKGRTFSYAVSPILQDLRPSSPSSSRALRAWRLTRGILANAQRVAAEISAHRPHAVLTHFSEYLAPFWAWRMRRLQRTGIHFCSVLHDPVRNHVVGPAWWHARSVNAAFGFLQTVFVHTREAMPVPKEVEVRWIPHGVYPFPPPTRARTEVRRELEVPEGAKLLTSFGYVRDNKNLDLIIQAIADLPSLYLIVAGSEQGGGNRPLTFYQELARQLGCADRCRWLNRFLSADETANLMNACDLALLVYSRSFVSSSGALGVTTNYQLPCLISSGSRTTEILVRQYSIGVWVKPDDCQAIYAGLLEWMRGDLQPNWAGYAHDNSWARNAELVEMSIRAALNARVDA